MPELSLAAQAVLDAATPALNNLDACGFNHQAYDRKSIAAALRAVADQVVPEAANAVGDQHDEARLDQWLRIRYKFLAIAAELDGTQSTRENV